MASCNAVKLDDDVVFLKHRLPRCGPLKYDVCDDKPALVGTRRNSAHDKPSSRGSTCMWLIFCHGITIDADGRTLNAMVPTYTDVVGAFSWDPGLSAVPLRMKTYHQVGTNF